MQLLVVVVLDVVTDKLKVSHASTIEPDACYGVVADVV